VDWLGAALGWAERRGQRVVLLLVLGLIALELLTGAVYYSVMDRRIALLKELHQLSTSGVPADPQLASAYQDLVTQLGAGPTLAYRPISVLKFLAGGSLGLYMLFLQLGRMRRGINEPPWWTGLLVGIFYTVTLGLAGALIPDLGSPWVNAFAYVFGLVVLLLLKPRSARSP
jgi:hypothetical protein